MLRPAVTIIFANGEASPAIASMAAAIEAARDPFDDPPLVMRGGGGYVLGEETTLINAIEGRKPVPRLRPPYPVESGLFGMPTVVNNVETITNLSVLFRDGVAEFRARGTAGAPSTRIFSVSGRVANAGVYEFPLGTRLSEILSAAGGTAATAVVVGGPSGGLLDPARADPPMLPGALDPTGGVMGSGGLVVLDGSSDVRAAALSLARFNAEQSCGKCTPCREGAPLMADALASTDHDARWSSPKRWASPRSADLDKWRPVPCARRCTSAGAVRMTLTVNGARVPEIGLLLDAVLAAGVELPHLCKDDHLAAIGACRTCLVVAEAASWRHARSRLLRQRWSTPSTSEWCGCEMACWR